MPVPRLKKLFPRLRFSPYQITSHRHKKYNCICHAADDGCRRWWWPSPVDYWPPGVRREETLVAFVEAFRTVGYVPAVDGTLEGVFEKVAIYAVGGKPQHMARQLPSGAWTSKLDKLEDIEHAELEAVNSPHYGTPVVFLKRPREPNP